ncbi:MAG: acyltransferase family protein [Nitrospirota bacterium]|nr:acyltransferase family protein [Nitrospirota bacterium]MDP2383480.1 acyltransferase family protein [Nitrospirota bacterium]MDP3597728.1 acyltransferase family protein [Nitrospirota bacterium]
MRNKTVDIARGIGILLVVFGHSWIVLHEKGELFRVIFSFHMPLFFLLSGIFLKETEALPSLLKSKANSLLKPYFVVLGGLGIAHILGGDGSLLYFIGLIYSTGSTIEWVQLWFLPHLFVVVVFSWLTVKAFSGKHLNKKIFALVPAVFLILGAFAIQMFWLKPMSEFGGPSFLFGKKALLPGLPFSVDLILISSAYFLAGYMMSRYIQSITFSPLLLLCAGSIFFGLHYFFDETIDLNRRIYGDILISSMQAFSGIYIVLSVSSVLSFSSSLATLFGHIGSGSIFILIFHWFFMDNARLFFDANTSMDPYVIGTFGFLLAVVAPLILLEVTRRQRLLSVLLLPGKSSISSPSP